MQHKKNIFCFQCQNPRQRMQQEAGYRVTHSRG